ncbi:hypothetical protein [Metapseudomonas otitidis]|uniref:hypothetical protein n=1 Tax=Metapseudomonas otitidis TaxID=319939 RepID=UPI001AAF1580|nr:hypothetical protein [Pseudomonas otitidis]MBO2927233.1 hypothetical protein [Pseudomonas otitidis]
MTARLQERQAKLVTVMQGRKAASLKAEETQFYVSAEDIRFAVDDVATALKEVRARMGKG